MSNQANEVFIGARALKEQINLILPTYNLLLEQIEQIRSVAENEIEQRKEHNNTIGIFGSRGTGKTSALYTIMQELEGDRENNEKKDVNIILPIIEPDNFGENTKIMGSIIGLLKDAVENELEKIKNSEERKNLSEFFKNCIFKENNPLKIGCDELIEYHLYTENEYRNLLTHNFDDTATHIKKSSYLLTPDIKFKDKLMNLINLLIEARKKINNSNETPLIFIFIDDIDLKTTKCKELIDSILQYANHPNVVTILSGDYDILKESITLALIADENLKDSNMTPRFKINSKDTIFDRKDYLANEYLKKIIPPARRHNVVKWNIKTIPNFAFGEKTLANQLDELLGDNNFFGYKVDDKIVPIKYCYSIFDKTPRGLVNVYYHIHQIVQSQNFKNEKNLFKNVKALIDTIVISSTELIGEQKKFFEECLLWGDTTESTFIDYKKMLQYEEDEERGGTSSTKKYYKVNKNIFSLFIICELLKQLVGNIGFINSDYEKFKNLMLGAIYTDTKDKRLNDVYDSEGNFINEQEIDIHNIILEVAKNINLESALLLLEYLTNGILGEDYRYEKINDENKYLKDRNVFIAVCNLIRQDRTPHLLRDLYLKAYDDNNRFLSKLFLFLNDICSTTQEFTIAEKTFKPLVDRVFEKVKEYRLQDELMRMLFVNALIMIQKQSNEKIGEILKNTDEKNIYYKQYRMLKNIFNKIEKSTEVVDNRRTERWKNNINKIIGKLGTDIHKLLTESNSFKLVTRNNDEFINAKDNFTTYKQPSGSDRTIYSQTKVKAKAANYFLYEPYYDSKGNDYYNIVESLIGLASNNRAWYGRQESFDFLEILKQQFYFDLEPFESMIPLIYELAIYLKTANSEIQGDNEFEEYKKYMKNELEKAFNEAKGDIETDLQEMGSSLEEDEEENK